MAVSSFDRPIWNGLAMTKRTSLLILAVVLIFAGLVRFWHLNARSVWFDEAFSLELATNCSLTELLDRTGRDVHPPGYYLLLKAWMCFAPRTEVGIRSLSATLGVLGVALLYLVTRCVTRSSRIVPIQNHSQLVSLSAALLLATNAQHVYWSREARMYTLGVVLSLSSTWLMLRWLRDSSWRWGFGVAVTTTALMLTHNYGLFTAACQAACVVWYLAFYRRGVSPGVRLRTVFTALIPFIVAVWLYLPWYTVLQQQRARVQQEFWIRAFSWKTIPTVFYQHVFPLNDIGPVIDWLALVAAAVVLFCAGAVALWFLVRADWIRDMWAIPTVMGLGPICIAVLVSIASVSVIETRHLSYGFPFLVMLFSAATFWLLPREWAIYTIVFAAGWSLFGEVQHRASLQTDERGGVRAAVQALRPKISESEIVVVQHPAIYHAVCFYLPNRDRIKLYLPAGLPRHFYGRPLIRRDDLISGPELDQLNQPRLMAVDTGGFGGDQGFPLPERWKRRDEQNDWFQDVAWYQGSIGVTNYASQTAAVPASGVESGTGDVNDMVRSSNEFGYNFTQYRYDREWFSLPNGVAESAQIRPTTAGLAFRPSFRSNRDNHYLSLRQNFAGDFDIATDWLLPSGDPGNLTDLSLRLLLTQNNSLFDVEPVDIRIRPREPTVELRCGRKTTSMPHSVDCPDGKGMNVLMRRGGSKLTVEVTMADESCECEIWISDQEIQLNLGDVVALSPSDSSSPPGAGAGVFLTGLQASAESIRFHADDGVTDITIAPSRRFWGLWCVAGLTLFCILVLLRRHSETRFNSEAYDGDRLT